MNFSPHAILQAVPSARRTGGLWLRIVLCTALMAMLFPLQPVPPCAVPGAAASAHSAVPDGPKAPGTILSEAAQERSQLCDIIPAKATGCLSQQHLIVPSDRKKTSTQQVYAAASGHVATCYSGSSQAAHAGNQQPCSSCAQAKKPARAPPGNLT